MTKQGPSQLVHESEVQRQHIRLPIPAQVVIADHDYALKDLSSGGFCIKDIKGTFPTGRLLPIILKLPFPQFTMSIPLDSQIQYYNEATRILGARFINLAPEQIAAINHVITSYIAGDIVGSSDMLSIVTRDNFTRARAHSSANENTPPSVNLRRQIPGLLVILVLGVLAVSLIGGNIYRHLFTIEAREATVMADHLNLRTQMGGSVEYLIPENSFIVTQGENIAAIDTGGLMPKAMLKSPCNCYIAERYVANGDYINAENPVVRLIPISARPWVQTSLSHNAASDLQIGQRATIKIFGVADPIEGRIVRMKSGRNGQSSAVLVDVQPHTRVPIDLADRPASVVFYTR